MLRGLDIRDMLIIDRLELSFEPGLNVLTGETGAGKSILLDALGFVLGWRGRAELVRAGAAQGEVTAWFDLPADHPAQAVLTEAGLPQEPELILRRINTRDGRKTAWVNGRRASGEVLRQLSDALVELHGQHDDRGLLNPRGHLQLLDQFADHADLLAAVRAAWRAKADATAALDAARQEVATIKTEEEFLRHAVAELDQLAPEPGEDAALDAQRRLMQAAERIRSDIAKAGEALGLNGAEGQMGDATRWLQGVAAEAEGRLEAPLEAIEAATLALDTAQRGVADCLDALSFNPAALLEVEERLFAIRGLARKHQVLPDDLAGFADDLRARLGVLDDGVRDLAALDQACVAAEAAYNRAAVALRHSRQEAAARLDQAMAAELAPLKMDRALFETALAEAGAGPEGQDAVTFTVATNPGAPAGALNKIASGGELSRFLLALKVCLTKSSPARTMIFDEIDRGVGGATADAVGRRLAALAAAGQVLVVTHAPQVAALGVHHMQVQKRQSDESTRTDVVTLAPEARVDEIARMLAGDTVTEAARAAAKALLDG